MSGRSIMIYTLLAFIISVALGTIALLFGGKIFTIETDFPSFAISIYITLSRFLITVFLAMAFLMGRFDDMSDETKNDLKKHYKDVTESLGNAVNIRYLGIAKDAYPMVISRLEDAVKVQSTFAFFGINKEHINRFYGQDGTEKIKQSIKVFVGNKDKAEWTDIVSQEVLTSNSLKWIDDIIGADDVSEKYKYRIMRLKSPYPIINFMILHYENSSKEVIFGWGHYPKDHEGHVFLTKATEHKDRHVVTAFEKYWETLEGDSVYIDIADTMHDVPIAPSSIEGLWFDAAYEYKDEERQPQSWIDDGENPVELALIKISIEDNRILTVEGRLFHPTEFTRIGSFRSTAASLQGRDLWYMIREPHVLGAGRYRLYRESSSGKPWNSRIERFYGEFSDFRSENRDEMPIRVYERDGEKRIRLFGKKIQENGQHSRFFQYMKGVLFAGSRFDNSATLTITPERKNGSLVFSGF
jgi:hypothetical protein